MVFYTLGFFAIPFISPSRLRWNMSISLLVLFIEFCLYYYLQNRIYSKYFANWHLTLLYISFILLPIIQLVAFRKLIIKPINPLDVVIMMRIHIFKTVLDIVVLSTAHIFFAINIFKSWQRKNDNDEVPGLLDEFGTQ